MTERKNVFFYGTLLDHDVLTHVLEADVAPARLAPATLKGYRRVYIRGRLYPMLVQAPDHRFEGTVMLDCTQEEWDKISHYESSDYDVERVSVRTAMGHVDAFIFRGGVGQIPTDKDWDLGTWQSHHKAAFMSRVFHEIT